MRYTHDFSYLVEGRVFDTWQEVKHYMDTYHLVPFKMRTVMTSSGKPRYYVSVRRDE